MTTHAIAPHIDRAVAGFGAADWLHLAAAPTFAAMALLTSVCGGAADMLCAGGSLPLSGMVWMYMLMSVFHSAPWLKLMFSSRTNAIGIAPHLSLSRPDTRH